MGESTYIPAIRDAMFVLKEQLKVNKLLDYDKYKHASMEDLDMVVKEAANYAKESISPINYESDREGAQYQEGKVKTPTGFKEVYDEFTSLGWSNLMYNEEFGGQQLPQSIGISTLEFFGGACQAFTLYPFAASSAAHVIENYGNQNMKDVYCARMFSGEWGGTMCLTEPQAGSDVGETKTMATPVDDNGKYKLRGTKIFITGAETDLTDNIIHLVLAKTPGAPAGTKGISLFLVPKYRVKEDGSLGDFNDVFVSGIEHKMGIKGSATCTVNFGDNDNCEGWLIGEINRGIVYMFQMMNEARMVVGLQGLALGSAAYQNAREYAMERLQGSTLENMKNPEAPRVPIVNHPDVRRMLMFMKSMVEGLRSFMLSIAYYQDIVAASADDKEKEKYNGFIELLLPICKAYGSDQGFEVCRQAVQTFGGYGYCGDYPVEQHLRDCKIASIYEGANGIQALDLLGRKMAMKQGMVFMSYMNEVNAFLKQHKEHPRLKDVVAKVADGAKTLQDTAMYLMQFTMKKDFVFPISVATPFLELFGHVVVAYYLLEAAIIADEKLEELYQKEGASDDAAKLDLVSNKTEPSFYYGRIKSAEFFANNTLAGIYGLAALIKNNDRSLLEIPEMAF